MIQIKDLEDIVRKLEDFREECESNVDSLYALRAIRALNSIIEHGVVY